MPEPGSGITGALVVLEIGSRIRGTFGVKLDSSTVGLVVSRHTLLLVIVINLAIKHGIEKILRGFGVVQRGRIRFVD